MVDSRKRPEPQRTASRGGFLARHAPPALRAASLSGLGLTRASADTLRVFAGKARGVHALSQEDINALLIAHSRRGRRVVRLKGGDPFVFGRGGEEALALAAAGIPFEVVPGVSAVVAAYGKGQPSYPTWLSENHVIELDREIVVHDAAQLLGP